MIVEVKRHVAGPLKGKLGAVPQVLGMEPHLLTVLTQVGEEFNQLTHGKDEKSLSKRIRGYKVGIFLSLMGLFFAIAKLLHNRMEPSILPETPVLEKTQSNMQRLQELWSQVELQKIRSEFDRQRWQVSTDHFYNITGKPLLSAEEIKTAFSQGTLRKAVMSSPHYKPFSVLQKMTLTTIDIVKHLAESEKRIFNDQTKYPVSLYDYLRLNELPEVDQLRGSGTFESKYGKKLHQESVIYSSKFRNTLRIVLAIASGLLIYFLNQVKIKAQRIAHKEAKEFLKTVSRERLSPFGVVALTTPALDRLIFTHNNKKAAVEYQHMVRACLSAPAPVVHQVGPYMPYAPHTEMVQFHPSAEQMLYAGLQYPHRMHPACRPSRPYYPVQPVPSVDYPHGFQQQPIYPGAGYHA